jgi:hypothetical protein
MVEAQTWRELLRQVINDIQERQRIADELRVNPITLMRWSNGRSTPRQENLRALLTAMPQHRTQFVELITKEFPAFLVPAASNKKEKQHNGIAAPFYANVLNTYTGSPLQLRSATVCALILQQMITQIDQHQRGLAIILAQCTPPITPGQKVRSLRRTVLRTSRTWLNQQEPLTCFFGAESQIGHAVSMGHAIIVQNRQEKERLFPMHLPGQIESFIAFPILLADRTAGGLGIGSTQSNNFTPTLIDLIQEYTNLIVLAFEPHEFYDLRQIELGLMPEYARQAPRLVKFQQRVTQHLIKATQEHRPLTRPEAEQTVWHELEIDLLRLACWQTDNLAAGE